MGDRSAGGQETPDKCEDLPRRRASEPVKLALGQAKFDGETTAIADLCEDVSVMESRDAMCYCESKAMTTCAPISLHACAVKGLENCLKLGYGNTGSPIHDSDADFAICFPKRRVDDSAIGRIVNRVAQHVFDCATDQLAVAAHVICLRAQLMQFNENAPACGLEVAVLHERLQQLPHLESLSIDRRAGVVELRQPKNLTYQRVYTSRFELNAVELRSAIRITAAAGEPQGDLQPCKR